MKPLGTTAEVLPYQYSEMRVRTSPLRGMPSSITTSNAEIRSVATSSTRAPSGPSGSW